MLAQVVGDPSSSGFGELGPGLGVLGSTLAVLLLLVATLLVLRLVHGARRRRTRAGGQLAVLEQVELSPGQSLYLVRVAGRCLLVGGTSGALGLITELDPAQVAAAGGESSGATWGAGTVAERLRARLFRATAATAGAAVAPEDHADHAAPPPRRTDLKVG